MWYVIALLLGAGLLALVMWLRSRKIALTWYEWVLGGLGLLLLLLTIQNFTASFEEHETTAAWTFLWMLGIPAIIFIGLAALLPWYRRRRPALPKPGAEQLSTTPGVE